MAPRSDVQRLAEALSVPRTGYVRRLNTLRTRLLSTAGEASRQLGLFIDRVSDLTLEELRELHRETFQRDGVRSMIPVAARLAGARTSAVLARTALRQLAPALDRLTHDNNPFAYVVRALCCLLLLRLETRSEHSST